MSADLLTARQPAPLDTPKTMDELWDVMSTLGNGDYSAARTHISMTDEPGFDRMLELERGIMANFHHAYDGSAALPHDLATQVQDLMLQLGCLKQNTNANSVGTRLAKGINWFRARLSWRTNGELA